jgi:predicted amidohydrolase YtcJ
MLRAYGIILMHTPKYATESPLATLIADNVTVGISPDGTVNPFFDIFMMVTQQKDPTERLTVPQAIVAFTKTNAFAEFKEKQKGTLSKGMLADLAVLSQDIFTIPPMQLMGTRSVLTMIDGQIVYEEKRN